MTRADSLLMLQAAKWASARPRLLALAILAVGAACSDNGETSNPDWGPLAVVQDDPTGAEGLIEGTLQVTNECVFLTTADEDVLLVWPAELTSWNDDEDAVTFDGKTFRNGDEVAFGGGGSSADESGEDAQAWLDAQDWAAEPEPACVTDIRVYVGSVSNV